LDKVLFADARRRIVLLRWRAGWIEKENSVAAHRHYPVTVSDRLIGQGEFLAGARCRLIVRQYADL